MFVSPAFSTPTRSMTSPQSSPFTPHTNFNKVSLSVSSAQQQRQGVSPQKAGEMEKAFVHLTESLRGAKALSLEEKIDFYVQGFQQLRKWRELITAYLAFFSNNGQGIVGLVPAKLNTCLIAAVYNSEAACYGQLINTTVPLGDLIPSMKQPKFDLQALVTQWHTLEEKVNRELTKLEEELMQTKKIRDAQIVKANIALYPSTQ